MFFSLIVTFYGIPLHTVRDVYITGRNFIVRVRDILRYREATKNMDERYPDVTHEEMERITDKTCIICREDMMVAAPPQTTDSEAPRPNTTRTAINDRPKRLPCGHIFHFNCLRSWLERQQVCPTW